jgi:hypothetical protein
VHTFGRVKSLAGSGRGDQMHYGVSEKLFHSYKDTLFSQRRKKIIICWARGLGVLPDRMADISRCISTKSLVKMVIAVHFQTHFVFAALA